MPRAFLLSPQVAIIAPIAISVTLRYSGQPRKVVVITPLAELLVITTPACSGILTALWAMDIVSGVFGTKLGLRV